MRPTRLSLHLACALLVGAAAGCRSAQPRADGAQSRGPAPGDAGRVLTEDDLRDRRVARAEELLEGRLAGVEVFRLPGGALAVRIRGGSSLLGSNEPLYVLDGMPLAAGPGGALHGIDPADIQRIEVLKDIGATALYGVRGANGVVLITTRRPPVERGDSVR